MRKREWVAALLAFLVAVALHARSLDVGYVSYDDNRFLLDSREIVARDVKTILERPVKGEYVPVRLLAHMLDRAIFQDHARGGHIVNVLVHGLVASLVVAVARRLGLSVRAAALAGCAFAVHPLAVESVAWISERKGLLVAAFLIGSFLSFGRGRRILALALFLLALGAKPTAITFPGILALDLIRRRAPRRAWLALVPFAVLGAGWMALQLAIVHRHGVAKAQATPIFEHARTILDIHAHYAWKLAWPWPLAIRYGFFAAPPAPDARDAAALITALLVFGPAILLARRGRAGPLLSVLACIVLLGTVSGAFRISVLVTDRYAYLPLIVFAVGLGFSLDALGKRSRALAVVLACAVLALYGIASRHRIDDWRDEEKLWRRDREVAPLDLLARIKYAQVLGERERFDEAALEARAAREIDPGNLLTLGLELELAARRGDVAAIESTLVRATSSPDARSWALAELADRRLGEGKIDEASRLLEGAAASDPRVLIARGHLAAMKGELDRAQGFYAASGNASRAARPWLELANLASIQGDLDLALGALEEARLRDEACAAVARERGVVLSRLGRFPEARNELEISLALDPTSFRTIETLAGVLGNTGELARAEPLLDGARPSSPDEKGRRAFNLAKVRALRGDREGARAALRELDAARRDLARQDPVLAPLLE